MKQRSEALESIPGVGAKIAQKLNMIGVHKISDLKHSNPEQLYKKLETAFGSHIDRCVLYVFRSAIYFANHERHDPEKLKWWNWKD